VGLAAGPAAAAAMDLAGLRAEWARRWPPSPPSLPPLPSTSAPPTDPSGSLPLQRTGLSARGGRRPKLRGGGSSSPTPQLRTSSAPGDACARGLDGAPPTPAGARAAGAERGGGGGPRAAWRAGGGAFSRSCPQLTTLERAAGDSASTAAAADPSRAAAESPRPRPAGASAGDVGAGRASRAPASARLRLPLLLLLLPLLLLVQQELLPLLPLLPLLLLVLLLLLTHPFIFPGLLAPLLLVLSNAGLLRCRV
jgi:hypothetical protein